MRLRTSLVALLLAVPAGLPLAASAQTTPCISCSIAQQNAAISAATTRVLVHQPLQSDLLNRLGTQQTTLQTQQLLNQLQIRSSLDQNDWAIRQILLQEQLNLLQLRSVSPPPHATKHKKLTH